MAPRKIHQSDAMCLYQVISPLSPRLPRVLPKSPLGEDIANDLGRRRLFRVADPGLEQAACEDRASTEGWRGSLSSVSSNYSRQTRAASVRPSKKRFGRLFSLFQKKGVQRAESASRNSRHSNEMKVSTTMRRAVGKFVGKVHLLHRDGSMAEHHKPSVSKDVGSLLGDLQIPDLVQNRINNGNVSPIAQRYANSEQATDKHLNIIPAVETSISKDIETKDKDGAIMPATSSPKDVKARANAEAPATPNPPEKNAKFEELSQIRSSKSGNEGYAALRGEKYNSKGPLYDDLAFVDAKPEKDSEDVRRSGYNLPELDRNEREFYTTYDHVPAAQNLIAADRNPRTKSEMAAQTGYILINKYLVDADSLHGTNRVERGLPAEQWEGSRAIARMPESPTDNNNNDSVITGHRDNVEMDDFGGYPKKDGPFNDNKGGPAAGNLDNSTTDASLSQEDMVKSRVAAWEKLTGKKAEPATKKSLGDSITTSSSNNSPDRPLVSSRMIIEMAKGVKRVETRSIAFVEAQTHKAVFERSREGPKPPSNREDIQDAKHRRKLNKSPGGGSKLSEYSVETHPSPKDTNEGHDLTRIPQFINKSMGASLMAPGNSSCIIYDRGRRNSVRKVKRSESLRSESAVSDCTVIPKSKSKSSVVHSASTLRTPEVNDLQALATARFEEAAQVLPAELRAVVDPAVPVADMSGTMPSHVCHQLTRLQNGLSEDQVLHLIEKVPTEQLMHMFHERLSNESYERETTMKSQATSALNEAAGPIHGLAYDYEQACLNRMAVAELREFRKTLHYTLNGWRVEQVMMAAHWGGHHASHEVDRKYAQDRLKEAKDKLIEVTRRINASDSEYTTMVQNMNKVRRQMMENARHGMGTEDFQTFERGLGSPTLSANSLNEGFSPAPQQDTPYQHVIQYNHRASNHNPNPGQIAPGPGISLYSHQGGPTLHPSEQMHSCPTVRPHHGRDPTNFSSHRDNNNNSTGPSHRQDPTPSSRQEPLRHRSSYDPSNHVPELSTPELTPEAAKIAAGLAAIIPPSLTLTRARNISAPARPQSAQLQRTHHHDHRHRHRIIPGAVAGATRAYRQPPPPMMTPERVRELIQPCSEPLHKCRDVEVSSSTTPHMPPARREKPAAAAGAGKSAMSVDALEEEIAVVAPKAPLPPRPFLGAQHVGDTEDLVLPPLPSPIPTNKEMVEKRQSEQWETNQRRSPMMVRKDSEQALCNTAKQYPVGEQQWRSEQEREKRAELEVSVVEKRSLDHLRMGFEATRGEMETEEERELREAEEEIRRMEAEDVEKGVLVEEDEE